MTDTRQHLWQYMRKGIICNVGVRLHMIAFLLASQMLYCVFVIVLVRNANTPSSSHNDFRLKTCENKPCRKNYHENRGLPGIFYPRLKIHGYNLTLTTTNSLRLTKKEHEHITHMETVFYPTFVAHMALIVKKELKHVTHMKAIFHHL